MLISILQDLEPGTRILTGRGAEFWINQQLGNFTEIVTPCKSTATWVPKDCPVYVLTSQDEQLTVDFEGDSLMELQEGQVAVGTLPPGSKVHNDDTAVMVLRHLPERQKTAVRPLVENGQAFLVADTYPVWVDELGTENSEPLPVTTTTRAADAKPPKPPKPPKLPKEKKVSDSTQVAESTASEKPEGYDWGIDDVAEYFGSTAFNMRVHTRAGEVPGTPVKVKNRWYYKSEEVKQLPADQFKKAPKPPKAPKVAAEAATEPETTEPETTEPETTEPETTGQVAEQPELVTA